MHLCSFVLSQRYIPPLKFKKKKLIKKKKKIHQRLMTENLERMKTMNL